MIPTIPVLLSAAPATATLVTGGLEPVFWTTVALVSIAVALIARDAWWSPLRASRRRVHSTPAQLRLVKPSWDAAACGVIDGSPMAR